RARRRRTWSAPTPRPAAPRAATAAVAVAVATVAAAAAVGAATAAAAVAAATAAVAGGAAAGSSRIASGGPSETLGPLLVPPRSTRRAGRVHHRERETVVESVRRPSATGEGGAPERWLERRVGEEEAGRTVRELLLRSFRLSRRMIRRLFQSHGIRLDGADPFLSTPVGAGAVLAVRLSSADAGALRPVPMELDIVLEDEDVLVVDKP